MGFRPVERMSEAACRSLTMSACALQASVAEMLVNVISNSRVINSIVCKSLSCEHKQCGVHRIQAINTRRYYAMLQFRLAVTFQRQIVDAKSHTFNFACSDSVGLQSANAHAHPSLLAKLKKVNELARQPYGSTSQHVKRAIVCRPHTRICTHTGPTPTKDTNRTGHQITLGIDDEPFGIFIASRAFPRT